jgi:hypothetical protein
MTAPNRRKKRNPSKEPITLSPDALEDLLISLEVISEARTQTIQDISLLRAQALTRYQEEMRELNQLHLSANKALLSSIDEAHNRGVPKMLAYEHVNLTPRRIQYLRRQVPAAEKAPVTRTVTR